MADEKIFQSRIQLKHDIEENWLKAINFIPKEGEIIIYDVDANNPTPRFKIGNGETVINTLPFVAAQADWNITDENNSGYIKNKPDYDKIVADVEELSANVAYIGDSNEDITDVETGEALLTSAVVQETGNSVTKIMSQNAVTNAINETRDFLLDNTAYITPEMYGAAGDGTTDDTIAIQTAIDASVNENKIVYLYKKTYATTAPLVFNIGLTKFICDGEIKYSGTEQAILVSGQNITIDIERISSENGTAVEFNDSIKSVLECNVHVGAIINSVKGFRMYTNSTNRCISYNKFTCGHIHSSEKCIEIWANTQWINENMISPGKMSGAEYGVYIYSDPSLNTLGGYGANDTTFTWGMFEDLLDTGTAIYLNNTNGNRFGNCSEYIRCQENYGSTIVSFNGNCSTNNITLSSVSLAKVDVANIGNRSYRNILQGIRGTTNGEDGYPVPCGIVDSRVTNSKITYNPVLTNVAVWVTNDSFTDNILGVKDNKIFTHYNFPYTTLNDKTFVLSDIYSNEFSAAKGAVVTLSFGQTGGRIMLTDCNGDLIINNTSGDYANKTISVQWAGYNKETKKNLWLINAEATENNTGLMSPIDKKTINQIKNINNFEDLKSEISAGHKNISLASDADITVSETLDLPEGAVIRGNGATIRRATGFETGLFNLSSGCRIENFTIEGNRSAMVNPKWDKTYEVNIKTDAQGCVIENITINNGNEGIVVSGYDNIVRGCKLYNCGGNGIRFDSAYRCIAEDCMIIGANKNASSMGNSHGCIYVYMDVKTVDIVNCHCEDGLTGLGGLDTSDKEHIKVIGCTFVGCTNAIEAKHVGETSPFDIVFSNNQFIENGTFNITTSRKDTSQIEGLIISDNTFIDTPLLIEGTRAAILRGNVFRFREFAGQGVQIKRSPHIVIEGNSFDSPNNIAIAIERCSAANILGNTIRYKTNAVNFSDSIGVAISNNIMRQVVNGGTGNAIHFNSSPEAAMDYNRIYTYSGNGIVVVNNTRATGNYIIVADSSQIAIRVWGGYKNYLVAQNMSNGTYSIATADSAVVQNNITIESTAFKDVTFALTNITSDGIAKCLTDDDYVCTLTAVDGYTLPDAITVTMGGTALVVDAGYTYDKSTGKVIVYRVNGALEITAG